MQVGEQTNVVVEEVVDEEMMEVLTLMKELVE